jgi:ABC-type antimicrobial peptide transport system permease subunit
MQGIRIRLGRSLVTIGGVVLGIAFLMSNLTGQVIKSAVQEEDQMRTEVRRMASFLAAEMGPPLDRVIGVIQTGPLNDAETRLIRSLVEGGLQRLQWCQASADAPVPAALGMEPNLVALDGVARDASSVLIVGSGPGPQSMVQPAELARLFDGAREKVLAFTREIGDTPLFSPEKTGVCPQFPPISVVKLARELSPEEIAKAEEDRSAARFRATWIVIISLAVTIGGIANAMLMSVTERFREIGTMKCLGALSSFIRWVFLLESGLMGAVGGIGGACLGTLFSVLAYGLTYGLATVLMSVNLVQLAGYLLLSAMAGVVLSIIAAIYPASVAASMVPAHALTTNV